MRELVPFSLVAMAVSVCAVLCGCSTMELRSPRPDRRIVLEAGQGRCHPLHTLHRWSLLFGAVSLNSLPMEEIASDPSRTYRITDKVTPVDALIHLFGGATVTLTRRTVQVEACDEGVVAQTPEDHERARRRHLERERKDALAKYLRSNPAGTEGPLFLMVDGSSHRGPVREISDEVIVIRVQKTVRKSVEMAPSAEFDRIVLHDGQSILGELFDQNALEVRVRVDEKVNVIAKSKIRRILFKGGHAPLAVEVDQAVPEDIVLPRSEIRRILLVQGDTAKEAAVRSAP